MRIVAGHLANLPLLSPGERVRPTMEPLRDAVMRALGPRLRGARVLDLFAGTGALGLEALSRGALTCDFIENGTSAVHALKANAAKVRAKLKRDKLDPARVFLRDALPFSASLKSRTYDIAFCDPPYGSVKLERVLANWEANFFASVLVLEHAQDHVFKATRKPVEVLRVEDSVAQIFVAPPLLNEAPPLTSE